MLRVRRYRVFLAFAVISLIALYRFRSLRQWDDKFEGLLRHGPIDKKPSPQPKGAGANAQDRKADEVQVVASTSVIVPSNEIITPTTKGTLLQVPSSTSEALSSSSSIVSSIFEAAKKVVEPTETANPPVESVVKDSFREGGQGRLERVKETGRPVIYWSQAPEHFPIPSENIIPIPTEKPKAIPKIQHAFTDESSSARISREEKQAAIKEVFVHSWDGYKEYAWMQDELSPISGQFRNPFSGWAATLVDSLDSLWIMDMKVEFDKAAQAVKDIDFTTSVRNDVPMFETTIRYLGGLIGAYDISGGKYRVLLDKAVELAEILMGAFDTPNRMPITYYYWKPAFASQPHRASTRIVLAELGSLSVEFTRLAQITKEPKYYDAIARITNEFASWQKSTRLPGLWPKFVDASGCKKPEQLLTTQSEQIIYHGTSANLGQSPEVAVTGDTLVNEKPRAAAAQGAKVEEPLIPIVGGSVAKKGNPKITSDITQADVSERKTLSDLDTIIKGQGKEVVKRQLTLDDPILTSKPATGAKKKPKFDCEPQGLTSPPQMGVEHFTLAGMADSVYEYLPKQYMLLGGVVEQYRVMYELAIEATNKHLLYRPMVPGDRNILHLGSASLDAAASLDRPVDLELKTEGSHLGCFAGGMFAVGAKIFGRKDDADIAAKLTDGCIWAYESTRTGIMPEEYMLVACKNRESCSWNQTKYYEALDPYQSSREANTQSHQQSISNGNTGITPAKSGSKVEQIQQANSLPAVQAAILPAGAAGIPASDQLTKRQLGDIETDSPAAKAVDDLVGQRMSSGSLPKGSSLGKEKEKGEEESHKVGAVNTVPTNTYVPPTYDPPTIPTHEEFVTARIKNEGLPLGFTSIHDKRYILRPEAIESVFIMYRTTGDDYWRDKGWNMFTAIQNYTRADYGNSAISDVTSESPYGLDEMESFWLAETLKYFYLLFSDPSLVSLDDWVLNTEAHPFKRPK